MRKFCNVLIISAIILLSLTYVSASGEYRDAGDLFQAWHDNMPDYISGVWSTDGSEKNLTFGIKESADVDAVQTEILSLVQNDSTVSFSVQKYSRNELMNIQEDIIQNYMGQESGNEYYIISTAVYEMENVVEISILEEKKDDPFIVSFVEEINGAYGDAIRITYGDKIFLDVKKITGDVVSLFQFKLFGIFALVAVIFFGVVLYLKKKQSPNALITSDGKTVAASERLTSKEVEMIVRNSAVEVPESLEEKIMKRIDDK